MAPHHPGGETDRVAVTPEIQVLLEYRGVIGAGNKLCFPVLLTSGQCGRGYPTVTWLFSKVLVSKSEFPEQGRGHPMRLRHPSEQISLCQDQLGPVPLTATAAGREEKEMTDVAGEGSVSPPSVRASQVPHTDQAGVPPAPGSWPLACWVSSYNPAAGTGAQCPIAGRASHRGLAHLTPPQPHVSHSYKIQKYLPNRQRPMPSVLCRFCVTRS